MAKVPLVVSTAPERIWLQVADDSYSATEAFPDDHAEITWCQDSVIATEVKYVRADLHEALAERCERLEAALRGLLRRDQNNTCQHDETHRGGAIWEICDGCGRQWADDRGGKPEWADPPEWTAAEKVLGESP